jgi:hypothetical protein
VLAEELDQQTQLCHERWRARRERVHHGYHGRVVLVEEKAATRELAQMSQDKETDGSEFAPRDVHGGFGRLPEA